jgi:hypothetical protein
VKLRCPGCGQLRDNKPPRDADGRYVPGGLPEIRVNADDNGLFQECDPRTGGCGRRAYRGDPNPFLGGAAALAEG